MIVLMLGNQGLLHPCERSLQSCVLLKLRTGLWLPTAGKLEQGCTSESAGRDPPLQSGDQPIHKDGLQTAALS